MIQKGGGRLEEEPTYVGLFLKFVYDKDNIVVGDGGRIKDGDDDGTEDGEMDGEVDNEVVARGGYCLFRLLLEVDEDMGTPLIPLQTYSLCKGMKEVVHSNLGMWVRGEDVVDMCLVEHIHGV